MQPDRGCGQGPRHRALEVGKGSRRTDAAELFAANRSPPSSEDLVEATGGLVSQLNLDS
jgi:hypothetical protein